MNATDEMGWKKILVCAFQWAPTLGGECYDENLPELEKARAIGFNGHPPLGVNATDALVVPAAADVVVSMGTHPWG